MIANWYKTNLKKYFTVFLLFLSLWYSGCVSRYQAEVVKSVPEAVGMVAITFDDAPDNGNTDRIMDIFDSYGVKCTFFAVGKRIGEYPESLQRIAKRGFEIGNHSENHRHMGGLSAEEVNREINACRNRIFELTGAEVNIIRAPYLEYGRELDGAARNLKMPLIDCSIQIGDWDPFYTSNMIRRKVANAQDGDIILMHCWANSSIRALPGILEDLSSRNLRAVTVTELLQAKGIRERGE